MTNITWKQLISNKNTHYSISWIFLWKKLQIKLFNVFWRILCETNLLASNITQFDEFFCLWKQLHKKMLNVFWRILRENHLSTQWKNEKFSLTKWIFRQINSLVISLLVKTLLSRNFCQKCRRLNRGNFHSSTCTR